MTWQSWGDLDTALALTLYPKNHVCARAQKTSAHLALALIEIWRWRPLSIPIEIATTFKKLEHCVCNAQAH